MSLSNRPGVTGRQRCGHESGYERSVRGFKPKTKQADKIERLTDLVCSSTSLDTVRQALKPFHGKTNGK